MRLRVNEQSWVIERIHCKCDFNSIYDQSSNTNSSEFCVIVHTLCSLIPRKPFALFSIRFHPFKNHSMPNLQQSVIKLIFINWLSIHMWNVCYIICALDHRNCAKSWKQKTDLYRIKNIHNQHRERKGKKRRKNTC